MSYENFKNACEAELSGLKSQNVQRVRDAIENLTTLAENHLQGNDLLLSMRIEQKLHKAFLQIVRCRKLSPKSWENFNNINFSFIHRLIAETAYRDVLGMFPS
jgi:hypothetical protein